MLIINVTPFGISGMQWRVSLCYQDRGVPSHAMNVSKRPGSPLLYIDGDPSDKGYATVRLAVAARCRQIAEALEREALASRQMAERVLDVSRSSVREHDGDERIAA